MKTYLLMVYVGAFLGSRNTGQGLEMHKLHYFFFSIFSHERRIHFSELSFISIYLHRHKNAFSSCSSMFHPLALFYFCEQVMSPGVRTGHSSTDLSYAYIVQDTKNDVSDTPAIPVNGFCFSRASKNPIFFFNFSDKFWRGHLGQWPVSSHIQWVTILGFPLTRIVENQ